MAVVSSIKHFNITNEYNEGANYFRRFLQYAEMVSSGNMQTARTILDGLMLNKTTGAGSANTNVIVQGIKKQLQQLGYVAAEQVGQSGFKCSLAVKLRPKDEQYTLSILVDDDTHYGNANLLEQYYQRPAILQSFGWKIIPVFAKDWLKQPHKVMEQIVKRLKEAPPAGENQQTIVEEKIVNDGKDESLQEAMPVAEEPALPVNTPYDHLVFQRFTSTENNSNKFWEVANDRNKLVVRFGKIATKGQTQVKTFADDVAAEKEKEKLIREKLARGYK
jgi:predicted DNA-binding WGR domain protein